MISVEALMWGGMITSGMVTLAAWWKWLWKPFRIYVDWDVIEIYGEEEVREQTDGYVCFGLAWDGSPRYEFWREPLGHALIWMTELYGRLAWPPESDRTLRRVPWWRLPWCEWKPIVTRDAYSLVPRWYGWVRYQNAKEHRTYTYAWLPLAWILRKTPDE